MLSDTAAFTMRLSWLLTVIVRELQARSSADHADGLQVGMARCLSIWPRYCARDEELDGFNIVS